MSKDNKDILHYGRTVIHYRVSGEKLVKQQTTFGMSRLALLSVVFCITSIITVVFQPELAIAALNIVGEKIGALWELRNSISVK